jgi:hypothetical protein
VNVSKQRRGREMDSDDLAHVAVIGGIIALIILLICAAIKNEKDWKQFKIDHQCKITAHVDGDVFNTFSVDSKGSPVVGIGSTPDKTGWTCNNGITYYK